MEKQTLQDYTVHSGTDFTKAVSAINASRTAGIYQITLAVGDGCAIANSGNTPVFTVESGNTLVLDGSEGG
jgi:hypothetical protein